MSEISNQLEIKGSIMGEKKSGGDKGNSSYYIRIINVKKYWFTWSANG